MASIYKKNNIWYVSTYVNGKRISKSLKTKQRKIAYEIMPSALSKLLEQSQHLKNDISFETLTELFLAGNNHQSRNTRLLYERILKSYISGDTLPTNPTSRAIYIRHINCCWNWGIKSELIHIANKLSGDTVGKARIRVLSDFELNSLKNGMKCPDFNSFVRLAYYTGSRSSEIRALRRENVEDDHASSSVKQGLESSSLTLKLNSQLINKPSFGITAKILFLINSKRNVGN